MMLRKVYRDTAARAYEARKLIACIPCKRNVSNYEPILVNKEVGKKFDEIASKLNLEKCNASDGCYLYWFIVEEDERMRQSNSSI